MGTGLYVAIISTTRARQQARDQSRRAAFEARRRERAERKRALQAASKEPRKPNSR